MTIPAWVHTIFLSPTAGIVGRSAIDLPNAFGEEAICRSVGIGSFSQRQLTSLERIDSRMRTTGRKT